MASEFVIPTTSAETDALLTKSVAGTSTPPRKILTDFVPLCHDAAIYMPPAGTPPALANSPTTIIFSAWMNALPKHIDYYVRTYKRLYPSARIIFIRISTIQFLFTSETTRRKQIKAVVDALLAFENENGKEKERLIVHSISNGGAKRSYGVAGLYLERTGRTLPMKVFLTDCAPGIPKFRRDMHALTVPLQKMNIFYKAPIYALLLVSVSLVYVCVNWLPYSVWGELVWRPTFLFNDKRFLGDDVLRGYVYSKEDLSIDWKDVEAHARKAEEVGYMVEKKLVEGAGHAQLWKGKGGEEDYWSWIQRLYEMGLRKR